MSGSDIPPELGTPKSGHLRTNADILTGKRIPPIQVVKTFSPTEFEEFTQEWAFGYLKGKGKYISVHRCGGTEDKGRDIVVVASEDKKVLDYYQCKHYDKALSPSDIWVELGKLCYFTHKGEIPLPRKYYFVAPKDVTSKLLALLHNPEKLKGELVKNWGKYCEKKISRASTVPLDKGLAAHIAKMDFSIFDTKPILDVINEHSETQWSAPRFGGGLRPRPSPSDAPSEIGKDENRYVEQLMEAYSDKENKSVSRTNVHDVPENAEHFKRQRDAFYSAEALRVYARETLPEEYDEFEKLKTDIHDGVVNTAKRAHANGVERVDAVADVAMNLPTGSNLLDSQVRPRDKHGITHHLANEDKLTWVPKQKNE